MKKRMKFLLNSLVFMGTLTTILAIITVFWSMQEFTKPGPLSEDKVISISKGSSLSYIAEKLEHEDIITNSDLFKISAYILGKNNSLKAGEYKISAKKNMQKTLALLSDGKAHQRFITIPEGLTSHEIVRLINNNEELSGDDVKDILEEGALLPETYSFTQEETKADIIFRMAKAMEKIQISHEMLTTCAGDEEVSCLPAPLKDWNDVITLASIVEKETSVPAERERVAGVFINRLKRGIALQTDPTVIYAITKGKHKNEGKGPLGRRLLKKDLEYNSPYNTYLYPNLPPGPIANPGEASIKAVLNPEKHNYIYFVADGTGGHAFAKTLEEHNRNVAQWRKVRPKN